MNHIIVTAPGTGMGKTAISAILATLLQADYWKPIDCGGIEESDSHTMESLLHPVQHKIHLPAYRLSAPLSPHHAARLEGTTIDLKKIAIPKSKQRLIIETAGGVLVPLTNRATLFDLFSRWNCRWVIVCSHYLGSINHTLLTIAFLKQHRIPILGIIFNQSPNPDSEKAILEMSRVPVLGRVHLEDKIDKTTIQRYADRWKIENFAQLL